MFIGGRREEQRITHFTIIQNYYSLAHLMSVKALLKMMHVNDIFTNERL